MGKYAEVLYKKGLFFYDVFGITDRKRGTYIVCCFLMLMKMNLKLITNSSIKMLSIKKSDLKTEVAAASVVLSIRM
ncbi:MAG: hypothetical protein IKG35_06440, partial [Erysipelotrichaceae bacterium]|nr:hypothetical protein [Erysipelotrichaceae bacterium]